MSAAATAAGYLYASGRLRGRNAREEAEGQAPGAAPEPRADRPAKPRKVRVAVLQRRERRDEAPEPREPHAAAPREERPRRVPKIEYRTRRWRPEE